MSGIEITEAADGLLTDALPTSPPPEVQAAMASADHMYAQLRHAGVHLKFESASPGRVSIELQDMAGHPIHSLSPSEALGLAGANKLKVSLSSPSGG